MILSNNSVKLVHRLVDTLVMLSVAQVASLSILEGRFGASLEHRLVFEWYGLVALYVAGSWATSLKPLGLRVAGVSALVLGCSLSASHSLIFDAATSAVVPFGPTNWLLLSICFFGSACCPRLPGKYFPPFDQQRT